MTHTLTIQTVTLNVKNLDKMANFYQHVVGLELLEQTETTAALGLSNSATPLLLLNTVTTPFTFTTGLYHTAFLLPERQNLAQVIRRLEQQSYPLDGASDHGYSEALYLQDPEGNGIEIYWDKPKELWDVRENGEIIGITEPIDFTSIMALNEQAIDKLPEGTIIGHVHLAVDDRQKENVFFKNILGFTITSEMFDSASFYGIDGYHHQFAGNIWYRSRQVEYNPTLPGLANIQLKVNDDYFKQLITRLDNATYPYEKTDNDILLKNPTGISFSIHK
ncbi:VOC family protein [Vagococcus coleopterorum]|uniref:VOC family protein n=1 Tax=Vagococcus coleopterorum TaxID=2714946 RepID=A0A6G8ANI2_9ENTE|nr:VOC family protein [Vagococcus coleopterorum]QIL46530.1 VOC family protein [Vagococcus coleopterorum]